MNKTILAVLHLAAAGQLLLVKPAHGIIFNFNWTSDAPGLSVLSGGPIITATGTLDINRLPGESFSLQDISNVNILVTRPVARTSSVYNLLVTDSTIRQYSVFNGPSISGMIDKSGDYVRVNDVHFGQFGCALTDCLNELVGSERSSPIVEINWGFGGFEMNSMTPVSGTVRVLFASTEVVRNSFQLTRATPVTFAIPYYITIGFFCAVVGIDRLKKWKNKKKESAKKDKQLKEEI